MLKGTLLGIGAGVVGAAVWAALVLFLNIEIGWIAIGIGAAVGAAVGWGYAEKASPASGLAAVAIAFVSIAAGKYAAVEILLQQDLAVNPAITTITEEYAISYYADDVADEWMGEGKQVNWPDHDGYPDEEADYPADVWAEAVSRWDAETGETRADFIARLEQSDIVDLDEVRSAWFASTFGFMDILFFGLGGYAAFSLGARNIAEASDSETA
ncbi:MAG: hypothetical protein AAF823_07150 [Planctomycetota bacterium]